MSKVSHPPKVTTAARPLTKKPIAIVAPPKKCSPAAATKRRASVALATAVSPAVLVTSEPPAKKKKTVAAPVIIADDTAEESDGNGESDYVYTSVDEQSLPAEPVEAEAEAEAEEKHPTSLAVAKIDLADAIAYERQKFQDCAAKLKAAKARTLQVFGDHKLVREQEQEYAKLVKENISMERALSAEGKVQDEMCNQYKPGHPEVYKLLDMRRATASHEQQLAEIQKDQAAATAALAPVPVPAQD